eukprot:Skav224227  [mRNA]  locus=scaffold939:1185730:1190316:+ [translate_table: standard]
MNLLCDCDPHRFRLPDQFAFYGGRRVELVCTAISDGCVWAAPYHPKVTKFNARCEFESWAISAFEVGRTFTLVDFEIDTTDGVTVLRSRDGPLMPFLHPTESHVKFAEAFSGIGGWSLGAELCGGQTVLWVDADPVAAHAFAKGRELLCLHIDTAWTLFVDGQLPSQLVLISDIANPKMLVIAAFMGVGNWLASPPCQPWSKASSQLGLRTDDGKSFARFIYAVGLLQPHSLGLECVPGLPSHPHFQIIIAAMKDVGLHLTLSSIDGVVPVLPITRNRWLATAVHHAIELDDTLVSRAKQMGMPKVLPGGSRSVNLHDFGAVLPTLSQEEINQCTPTQEALDMMSRADLLPLNMRDPGYLSLKPHDVLALRVKSVHCVLPNVMASQGSQHKLPIALLREKGLYTFLIDDGSTQRYICPFEVACAMGFDLRTVLPRDFHDAWRATGNALTVPQAMLQCVRAWCILRELSGFDGSVTGPFALVEKFLKQHEAISGHHVVFQDGWMMLRPCVSDVPIEIPDSPSQLPELGEQPCDDETDDEVASPPRKLQCTATQQFMINTPPCAGGEVNEQAFQVFRPKWGALEGAMIPMPLDLAPAQIFVCLMHDLGIWARSFVTQHVCSLKTLIQCELPHASAEHFRTITVNGWCAIFHATPMPESRLDICFATNSYPRVVVADFMEQQVTVEVDAVWTIADLSAVVASKASVLPSQVEIIHDMLALDCEVFVLSVDATVFSAKLVANVLPFTRNAVECPMPKETTPGQSTGMRVTTMNPKWQHVRSVEVENMMTLTEVLQLLLPGTPVDALPTVYHEGVSLPGCTVVGSIDVHCVHLHFDLATGEVSVPMLLCGAGKPSPVFLDRNKAQTVYVRGPLSSRAEMCHIDQDQTLLTLVATALQSLRGTYTTILLSGGKLIMPTVKGCELQSEQALEIRLCALPGGAKNDTNAKKLKAMLSARGVPEEALSARVALITSKITASELATILAMEEAQAWTSLKKRANEAKLRMITSIELREHQQAQRKKATAGASSSSAPKPKKNKSQPANAPVSSGPVSVDPKHFVADGMHVPVIPLSKWGPDMKGLVFATPQEATKMLPCTKVSPDPLAVVVVTNVPFADRVPVSVPATGPDGQPQLASVVILNYGDVAVQCQPDLPSVELQQVDTAVLEVMIVKKHVAQWSEAVSALHYLGLQLPELRRERVIASWAFHPFDDQRQRCQHSKATYVHGYLKVPSNVLDATLLRSGSGGIFLQVRDDAKKLDSRFGIITMHGMSFEDISKLAKATPNVLGFIKLGHHGDTFALRARREHLNDIRTRVLPQAITLHEGVMSNDGKLWTLRNCSASTTCTEMTAALRKLGWQATAIKPTGKATWLISSPDSPPATHLCLGSEYVAVVPLKKDKMVPNPEQPTKLVAECSFCPEDMTDGASTTTTATRISDMKQDLEEQLSKLVSEKISTELQACHSRIDQVSSGLELVQREVAANAEYSAKQFHHIDNTMASNQAGLLKEMQSLFTKMQSELDSSIATRFDEHEKKRTKFS